jgi:uncharacterized protein
VAAKTLNLGEGLQLPVDLVQRATAILGQRGTGKTSTAVVAVEEAAAAGAQFVVIDPTGAWYGLKSSGDGEGPGLDCVVMGGHNADVPLDSDAGEVVARLVLEQRYNLVLDLELMSKTEQVKFVAVFLETLYHLCRSQVLVVIDEAHRFAPQNVRENERGGYGTRCLGAVVDVVTLGRRKGLGIIVISQRLARLHKDALEVCEVVIAHRLRGSNDRKALSGWLEDADEDVAGVLTAVSKLPDGTAHVSAPTLDIEGVYRIRMKWTFDSSRSIGIGETALEPRARSDIDLGALKRLMADTLEKAKENDPKALRDELKQVRKAHDVDRAKLDAVKAAGIDPDDPAIPEGGGIDPDTHAREKKAAYEQGYARGDATRKAAIRAAFDQITRQRSTLGNALASLDDVLTDLANQAETGEDGDAAAMEAAAAKQATASRTQAVQPPPIPTTTPPTTPNGDKPALKLGARRMIHALLDAPRPLTREELGTLANVRKGGTMSDYLSAIRGHQLIDESSGRVAIVDRRAAAAALGVDGGWTSAGRSPAEVVDPHRGKLKAGARRMLDELMAVHPEGLTRDELARRADVSKGGTFSDYLSSLKTRGLAVEGGGEVKASPTLYLWQ